MNKQKKSSKPIIPSSKTMKGQCLCGLIQYEVNEIEPKMAHCHCSMCRKFHGSAFATFGEAKKENFTWTQGEHHLKTYEAPNGTKRKFCDNCGSSLIFEASKNSGFVEFSLGTLDSTMNTKPDAHIFMGDSADWYEANDNLPKFSKDRE